MKKSKFIFCLLIFIVSLNVNGISEKSQTSITKDTIIKDNKKILPVIEKDNIKIEDYKKATDSILTITEHINLKSETDLKEYKKLLNIINLVEKKTEKIKKETKENINKLINKNKKDNLKRNLLTKNLNYTKTILKIDSIYIVGIDSIYIKKTLFRKSRYVYVLKFSNGSEKIIKNN